MVIYSNEMYLLSFMISDKYAELNFEVLLEATSIRKLDLFSKILYKMKITYNKMNSKNLICL